MANINEISKPLIFSLAGIKGSGKQVSLLSITTAPSGTFKRGSRYYNSTTKLIYTATADNTWNNAKSASPEFGVIYIYNNNGTTEYYQWDGDNLVETDLEKYQLISNKTNSYSSTSVTTYPTSKALRDGLDTKQGVIEGAASSITDENLAAEKAVISDENGKIKASSITKEELESLSGVSGNVQNQLGSKQGIADRTDNPSETSTTKYPSSKALSDGLDTKITKNTSITGGTKCKITYDAKGLVVAGSDLEAGDIPDISSTYETKSNKVTEITEESTDTQYASAKAIRDYVTNKINDYKELAVEMSPSGVFVRQLGAIGRNLTPSTDVAAGVDDFKNHPIFETYDCLVTLNTDTGKAEEFAPEGTYEFNTHVGLPGYYVITMFPKFYYKLEILATGNIKISLTTEPKTGYKVSPAHNRNGRIVDWIGIGKYAIGEESADANEPFAVRSGVCPKTYTSVVNFETLVRQKGLRLFGYKEMLMIQLLATVKYASLNWQSKISQGNTNGWTNKKAVTTASDVNYVILTATDWAASTKIDTVPATMQCVAIGNSDAAAKWYKVLSIEDVTETIDGVETACKKITIDGTVSTTANTTLVYLGMQLTGATDNVLGADGENTGGGTISGTSGQGKRMCKNLGIESLVGNCGQNLGGIVNEVVVVDGVATATMLINPNPDGAVDYPTTSDRKGWIAITNKVPTASRNNYKFLPSTDLAQDIFLFGDTSGGFTGDYQYFTTSAGIKRVFYGGRCSDGAYRGGFYLHCNSDLSSANRDFGGRCVFVPGL